MKIQERTGAGAGRSAAPAQPSVGDRLPTPPRERKPALAALAVLLILVGALGATMLVLQVGDRVEVVKVTRDIQQGESVTSDDVTSALVAADDSINYVKWNQLSALKNLKARTTIYKDTVVMGQMFGEDGGVAAGKSTVGLSLKAGQYPTGLQRGDTVAAYRVSADSGAGNSNSSSSSSAAGNSVIVDQARVTYVPGAKNSGDELVSSTNLAVTLTVDSDKAADLAQAASNGEVALVLVSGKSGN
ncbi:SAF domain-containing protein [Streptomyces coeruleorubidus]|uniref:SAF domain-containing protein n=1 Tax=Streptomyces coeruleorubidus TaxID=116188 RepID=UPI0033CCC733